MPKRTIDELIAAIEAVQVLQQIVAKHDQAIAKLIDKLDQILHRLEALPDDSPKRSHRSPPNADHAHPDHPKPDHPHPDHPKPDHPHPDHPKPNRAHPDRANPDRGND